MENTQSIKKKEEIDKLRKKLNDLKEKIYKIISNNDSNPSEFFDEIFNLQNDVLSSNDIREAKLEKEFNQILKVLNLLHSIQDNKIKNIKTDIFSLLQDYLDTKEKLLELTEVNNNTLALIKKAVQDIKFEINQLNNKKNKMSNIALIFSMSFGKIFKNSLFQKLFSYLLITVFFVLFLYFIKHLDIDLYKDTKGFIENSVKTSQQHILNSKNVENSKDSTEKKDGND